ncbi:MAG: signal peptidase I [Ruminococcaceae bacterium]|nr:signal peptidase I [Oscillospiraceae bacterium]
MRFHHQNEIPEENDPRNLFEQRILREQRKKSRRRLFTELVITAVTVFVVFRVIAGVAVVRGDSMKPNLTNGSLALFYRLNGTYRKNDIVIFRSPGRGEVLIKRVVAVAGDQVDIDDKTGELLVNGTVQQEDSIKGKTYTREGGVQFPLTVPDGYVFVLGDNREAALDSRNFDAVSVKNLIGKVFFEVKRLAN